MIKHTPGPWGWFQHRSDGSWHIGPSPYEYHAGQPTIADIGEHGSPEEKKANARFIAAAPEMYEAIRSALGNLDDPTGGTHVEDMRRASEHLRKALLKIEGRE